MRVKTVTTVNIANKIYANIFLMLLFVANKFDLTNSLSPLKTSKANTHKTDTLTHTSIPLEILTFKLKVALRCSTDI